MCFLIFSEHQYHLGGLLNLDCSLLPKVSDSAVLGWGLRICLFNKCPEDADASSQLSLWGPRSRRLSVGPDILKGLGLPCSTCSMTRRAFLAAHPPMETWSSVAALVERESTEEGWHRHLFSETARGQGRLRMLLNGKSCNKAFWLPEVAQAWNTLSRSWVPQGLGHYPSTRRSKIILGKGCRLFSPKLRSTLRL